MEAAILLDNTLEIKREGNVWLDQYGRTWRCGCTPKEMKSDWLNLKLSITMANHLCPKCGFIIRRASEGSPDKLKVEFDESVIKLI